MKKVNEVWKLILEWLKIKLRRPFSNLVTKTVLITGVAIVASPIIEHLIFSAILKDWLGIDLGINVPDLNAYIFGTLLILIGVIHNLVFIKLNQEHQIKIKDAKSSVYKELWHRCDKMVDDVVRLKHLYITVYDQQDDEYALKAEESTISFMKYLRQNRPFIFSEELYSKGTSLGIECDYQTKSFRGCIKEKKRELSLGRVDYCFDQARKVTKSEMRVLEKKYESICSDIREYVEAI